MTSSSATAPSPRVTEKRRRRRAEILGAALRAFRERGYHDVTLEHVADRLGIRKSALYHYFRDKESILFECHRTALAEMARLVETARERHHTATEQLDHVIREHVRMMTDTLQGWPSAFEVSALSEDHQREIVAGRDAYEQSLRDIIQRGIDHREFRRDVDPKTAVFVILGAVNWIGRWFQPDGSWHASELGARYAEHLIGGILCRS